MSKARAVSFAGLTVLATVLAAGCGTTDLTSQFMSVDAANQTVTLKLIAGYNSANDYQNFDGYANGKLVFTVPAGYKVKLDFENSGGMPADIGVYNANLQLAFKGAGDSIRDIVENPTPGIEPGDSQTLTFTAAKTGTYRIDNLIYRFPEFSQTQQDTGMWVQLDVVANATPSAVGH